VRIWHWPRTPECLHLTQQRRRQTLCQLPIPAARLMILQRRRRHQTAVERPANSNKKGPRAEAWELFSVIRRRPTERARLPEGRRMFLAGRQRRVSRCARSQLFRSSKQIYLCRSCRLDLGSERARSGNACGRGSRRWGRRCGTDRLHRVAGSSAMSQAARSTAISESSAATVMCGIAARATGRPAPHGAPRSANTSVALATSGRARITATTDSA
jgi:hypothetical protein